MPIIYFYRVKKTQLTNFQTFIKPNPMQIVRAVVQKDKQATRTRISSINNRYNYTTTLPSQPDYVNLTSG